LKAAIQMPITTTNIPYTQRVKLLTSKEGHFLDFKSIDVSPGKLTRHICAFANADGGELYIGIDEEKDKLNGALKWRGFRTTEDANGFLQIFERLFPLGQNFCYEFLSSSKDGLVLHIEIRKTLEVKYTSDNKVYIRRGAQSLPVEGEEALNRLKRNKGVSSFESEIISSADISHIIDSKLLIDFLIEVVPSATDPEIWLRKQLLIRDDKPTVGGVLLFCEEPQAVLPKHCGIKIYRYMTNAPTGTRESLSFHPVTIEGNIYSQIKAAVSKTIEIIESTPKLDSIRYPHETLHEIITNAVLHRDYGIADDIHVRIFDDRIEVQSPGTLPGHVTVSNILNERFARNGALVRIINKFPDPPNKDIGEGINTAFNAMRNWRLKEPKIEQKDNSVIIFIRHESLGSPEEILLSYLDKNTFIKKSEARRICHVESDNKMTTILQRLVRDGQIERVPELKGNKSAYQKIIGTTE
jgi:ATP-dependent DNA helicase RecG